MIGRLESCELFLCLSSYAAYIAVEQAGRNGDDPDGDRSIGPARVFSPLHSANGYLLFWGPFAGFDGIIAGELNVCPCACVCAFAGDCRIF